MLDDPIITSDYNICLKDVSLLYVRDECININAAFFVHLILSDVDVLPEHKKIYGYENLDFRLADSYRPSKLGRLAIRELPKYDIAAIRTGQYTRKADPGRPCTIFGVVQIAKRRSLVY